jgi:uncharacterized protein involved in response to NO
MVTALAVNAYQSIVVARTGSAPVFPFEFNQRFLVLISWGFIVPFIWGFSSRWIPPLLGLRKTRKALVLPALALLLAGVAGALVSLVASAVLLFVAATLFVIALRFFEPSEKEPKLRGVHPWSPHFLRIAYGWSIAAAAIAIASALRPLPNGYAGASRHALTVGFFAAAVFTIGPRVLPAFFNRRHLWSSRLMAASLILLNAGCVTRVVSQILAYENISAAAWKTLPVSAAIEMVAVTLFAFNMLMTLTTGSPLEALATTGSRPLENS